MSNAKSMEMARNKKDMVIDPQLAEADSSTNSGEAHSVSETTRQSSLQRIQMRKEKVIVLPVFHVLIKLIKRILELNTCFFLYV